MRYTAKNPENKAIINAHNKYGSAVNHIEFEIRSKEKKLHSCELYLNALTCAKESNKEALKENIIVNIILIVTTLVMRSAINENRDLIGLDFIPVAVFWFFLFRGWGRISRMNGDHRTNPYFKSVRFEIIYPLLLTPIVAAIALFLEFFVWVVVGYNVIAIAKIIVLLGATCYCIWTVYVRYNKEIQYVKETMSIAQNHIESAKKFKKELEDSYLQYMKENDNESANTKEFKVPNYVFPKLERDFFNDWYDDENGCGKRGRVDHW